MDEKLSALLGKIKDLEQEILGEIQKKEEEFGYTFRQKKVHFTEKVIVEHKKLVKKISRYLREAKLLNIITAPVIWSCLMPVVVLDAVVSFYQFVCFPIYKIPKVLRSDYVVMDRRKLGYLNRLEMLNCVYCEYVNGFLAYAQEIAGRTEQHWCPIKHAVRLKTMHSRYQNFFDYGDAEQYRRRIEEVRHAFEDLKKVNT